jgi:hypothetical protein
MTSRNVDVKYERFLILFQQNICGIQRKRLRLILNGEEEDVGTRNKPHQIFDRTVNYEDD